MRIWDEEVPPGFSPERLEALKEEARRLASCEVENEGITMEIHSSNAPTPGAARCAEATNVEEHLLDDQSMSLAYTPPRKARVCVEEMGFKPTSLEVHVLISFVLGHLLL